MERERLRGLVSLRTNNFKFNSRLKSNNMVITLQIIRL
jgi:hypothetical protein